MPKQTTLYPLHIMFVQLQTFKLHSDMHLHYNQLR